MSNDYYNATTLVQTLSRGSSAVINSILQSIASGFELLPEQDALNQNRVTLVTAAGSANTITTTMSPTLVSYVAGLNVRVAITTTNTGSTTLNIDGLGARAILRTDLSNVEAGDLTAGDIVDLIYDGTRFVMQSTPRTHMAGVASNLAGDLQFTGNPVFEGDPAFNGSPDFSGVDNASTIRGDLGLAIGSQVQAFNSKLSQIAAISGALTTPVINLLSASDEAEARAALGVGLDYIGSISVTSSSPDEELDIPSDIGSLFIQVQNFRPVTDNAALCMRVGSNGSAGAFEFGVSYGYNTLAQVTLTPASSEDTLSFWYLTPFTSNSAAKSRRSRAIAFFDGFNDANGLVSGLLFNHGINSTPANVTGVSGLRLDTTTVAWNALQVFCVNDDNTTQSNIQELDMHVFGYRNG